MHLAEVDFRELEGGMSSASSKLIRAMTVVALGTLASACNSPTEQGKTEPEPEPEPVALVRVVVTGQMNGDNPFVATVAGTLTGHMPGPPGGRVPWYLEVRLHQEGQEPRVVQTQGAAGAFTVTQLNDSSIAWHAHFIGLPSGPWEVTASARDANGRNTNDRDTIAVVKPEAVYDVVPLALPAGLAGAEVVTANEIHAVGVAGSPEATRALLWSATGVSVLPMPDTGSFRPTKVNGEGVVVGSWSGRVIGPSGSLRFAIVPVRWMGRRMETLGDTNDLPHTWAIDVNGRGDVLTLTPARIFTDTDVVSVPISPGLLDSKSRVVGYSSASDGGMQLATWDPSQPNLSSSSAGPPVTMNRAIALNENGTLLYASGYSFPYSYGVQGVFVRSGAAYDIPLIAAWQLHPSVADINDHDWVVGAAGPAFFVSGDGKALRVVVSAEWRISKVVALTNSGTIYAMATGPATNGPVPVRLIPR